MQRIQKTIARFLERKNAPVLGPDASVAEAVELMKERAADCALVVEDRALVGIFTERDFLHRVIGVGKVPAKTPLRHVMTPDPDRLRPHNCVSYAIERMSSGGYRNVPIVDDNAPVGVLSVRDVMAHLNEVFVDDVDDAPAEEWIDIGGG